MFHAAPTAPSQQDIELSRVDLPLHPAPIEPGWIIEGEPKARASQLSRSSDGTATTVVWDCTEGKFHWHYDVDETILILEGSVVIESDTMKPTRFSKGEVILFRKGAHARWHVEQRVRKIAFCQRMPPRVVSLGLRGLGRLVRLLRARPAATSPLGVGSA